MVWTFDLSTVVNSGSPLGDPGEGTTPVADVPARIYETHNGGGQTTPILKVLTLCHAIQCRVLREIERRVGGDKDIGDRLYAMGVGCSSQVLRNGDKAVRVISQVHAGVLQYRINKALGRMSSDADVIAAREKQIEIVAVLHNAKQDAARMANLENAFRRNNVVPLKPPGFKRLQSTFLPSQSDVKISKPHVSELIKIAIFGLINPADMYKNFYFLHAPFASATALGAVAVYERHMASKERAWFEDVLSKLADGKPTSIRGYPVHEALFDEVMECIAKAWSDHLDAPGHLQKPRVDRPKPKPSH